MVNKLPTVFEVITALDLDVTSSKLANLFLADYSINLAYL